MPTPDPSQVPLSVWVTGPVDVADWSRLLVLAVVVGLGVLIFTAAAALGAGMRR